MKTKQCTYFHEPRTSIIPILQHPCYLPYCTDAALGFKDTHDKPRKHELAYFLPLEALLSALKPLRTFWRSAVSSEVVRGFRFRTYVYT